WSPPWSSPAPSTTAARCSTARSFGPPAAAPGSAASACPASRSRPPPWPAPSSRGSGPDARAGVDRARADGGVAVVLLEGVGDPAGGPGDGEDRLGGPAGHAGCVGPR